MSDAPPRCLGRKFDRHDPRPMARIDGGDVDGRGPSGRRDDGRPGDVYRCPACESRVEVRGTAA